MPKIKNIIIFVAIAAVVVLIYIYFIKPSGGTPALVSSAPTTAAENTNAPSLSDNSQVAGEFLSLLLNVRSIELDDSIFSDNAFISLHDSSITLTQDGTEGRVNPFAPLGSDAAAFVPATCTLPKVLDAISNTCVNPPVTCTPPQVLNTTTNTCVNPPRN